MMDTSETYIKMCEKAVEIQRSWKLEAGDYFTRSLNDLVYILEATELQTFGRMSHQQWIGSKIWLPRQDQLQEMVGINKPLALIGRLERFTEPKSENRDYDWEYKMIGYITSFTSMEQLWLAYMMSLKFNKQWDGEKWVMERKSKKQEDKK